MEVFYNEKLIKDGEFCKISETQIEPKIKLNMNSNKFYTLIMYDPDAISGTYIHWTIINITNNDIKTGNILVSYKGPAPPINSGKHRYIFNLYKQDRKKIIDPINERIIDIEELRKNLKVGDPIIVTKFISENEGGGKKLKRKSIRKKNKKLKRTRRR